MTAEQISQAKEFILWCKEHGVRSASLGSLAFELAPPAIIPRAEPYAAPTLPYDPDKNPDGHKYGVDDETLFYSSGGA